LFVGAPKANSTDSNDSGALWKCKIALNNANKNIQCAPVKLNLLQNKPQGKKKQFTSKAIRMTD